MKKSIKKDLAITLISLIVTIIILLIIATISIQFLLGENGILNKAKIASNEYSKAQEQENVKISNTVDIIDQYTTSTSRASTSVNMSSLHSPIFNISYSSSSTILNAGTKYIADFTRNTSSEFSSYLSYNSTTGNLEVAKSGWYYLNSSVRAMRSSGDGSLIINLIVNNMIFPNADSWMNSTNTEVQSDQSTTLWLNQGDTVNFKVNNTNSIQYVTIYFFIYPNFNVN